MAVLAGKKVPRKLVNLDGHLTLLPSTKSLQKPFWDAMCTAESVNNLSFSFPVVYWAIPSSVINFGSLCITPRLLTARTAASPGLFPG